MKLLNKLKSFSTFDRLIILGSTLIILSVLIFLGIYFVKPGVPNTHRGSLHSPGPPRPVSYGQILKGEPSNLAVPSLGISLNVIKGWEKPNGLWVLTPNNVQYAIISPEPNNHEGNTVIYGHATTAIFGKLFQIKKGSTASITTSNGYIFSYRYEGTYSVNPFDFSIFSYKGAPILTLQTCSGTFYQNRQMFQFSYLGFNKVKQS